MPPSTLEMEKTPERDPYSSPSSLSYSCNAPLSQPRSLKVCKPYSRVYPHGFPVLRPRQVSRNGIPSDNIEKTSTIYTYDRERSYFEQCFKEVRVLGRGLFGEALQVECRETGKHYAVKRALHTFESAGNRQQKLREAINHEAIPPHDNIVRFEKAWEERGRLYIQTELCGPNLSEYRNELGVLREHELWRIFLDMVKALHHMHSSGMLHMDVKPSNIFIFKNSICKLGDFGLAFNMNETALDTAEEGDKYYMAPEILNNSPTTAADVYSLGVSMLELATTVDVREHCHEIRSGELANILCTADQSFTSQQNDLHGLILSLLCPDPRNRPSTSQLMNSAKLLANNQKPVFFRELKRNREVKIQTGPLDKDWNFESEDEIHPPSLRFSKYRLPINGDIFDTAENVRSLRRRVLMRGMESLGATVKKLDFSDAADLSTSPSPKRKRSS
ncbi:hypothetical protein KIN20_001024 [Parelaphostrongylus tenuis]|nr:hypothetical protein KIN20_001024 [Parelaphostrongylus tenuis]